MAEGINATNLANVWLTTLDGAFVQLHTGDPGAAGTANASAETTRKALTWAAAAAASRSIAATLPTWTPWTAGNETITDVSVWSAVTDGNFLYSYELATPVAVTDGDTLSLLGHTVSLAPVAA